MSRPQKNPLRYLEENEKAELERISRSHTETFIHVARAKALLAVSQGYTYKEAAFLSGRRSEVAVSRLVSRFNKRSLRALDSFHGGGVMPIYGSKEKQQILECFRQKPDIEEDGSKNWSLSLMQAHLEKTPIGHVSINTIWRIVREGGYSFQRTRTWVDTGKVIRKRKGKLVEVEDPDKEAKKKNNNRGLHRRRSRSMVRR